MPKAHRFRSSVRLPWLLSALLLVTACLGTETGNPPVIDQSLLSATLRGEQLEISGGAGAVLPGGSTLWVIDLDTNRVVKTITTAADGSFVVVVDKTVRAALHAENEHGRSADQAAPLPRPGGAAPESSADASVPTALAADASRPADAGGSDTVLAPDSSAPSGEGAEVPVAPDVNRGATVASITANGTGCPAGAWSVERAAGGNGWDVLFVGYEATTSPNASLAVKDCTLAVKVDNRADETYALTSAVYSGNASVGAGASAELSTSYTFQGDPSLSATGGTTFAPQAAADFTFQDDLADSRAVWSPCGLTRDLNITTRVRLTGGTGSVSLTKLSGIKLSTRACPSSAAATGSALVAPRTNAASVGSVRPW